MLVGIVRRRAGGDRDFGVLTRLGLQIMPRCRIHGCPILSLTAAPAMREITYSWRGKPAPKSIASHSSSAPRRA
jgi:hypothetical protein